MIRESQTHDLVVMVQRHSERTQDILIEVASPGKWKAQRFHWHMLANFLILDLGFCYIVSMDARRPSPPSLVNPPRFLIIV